MIGYQRVVELARKRLPVMVSPDGNPTPQEDWRVIRIAFLARIARTAEALSALVPIGARLDGVDLARNMLEHVACLAWIAADPNDRLDLWLKKDYLGRIRHDERIRRRIEEGVEARWPEAPLSAADRAAYSRHVQRVRGRLPAVEDMCATADEFWLPRYPAGLANHRSLSFADLYTYIYDTYSWMAHPRLTGLQSFWDFQPQWTLVHGEETGDRSHDPLHMGQLVAGHGLLVSAMVSGMPSVDEAVELLQSNADLAELVRRGSVVTEEVAPGRFELRAARRR
jgi:hypothetical protein